MKKKMNKINYQLELDKIIKKLQKDNKTPTLLMHSCCAPCSSYCLSYLAEYFKITIFYYNPNITSKSEYDKRLAEVQKFAAQFKIKYPIEVIAGDYEKEKFLEMAKGLENEPERGKRCYLCYKLRLEKTAQYASEHHFDFFATTLTLSPYKNANWLNEIGESLNKEISATYLYSDFKKKNGYKRSIELSKKYNLYRQNYCGCIYSKIGR